MKGQGLGSVEIKLMFPFQITEPCEASWKVGSKGMKRGRYKIQVTQVRLNETKWPYKGFFGLKMG